TVLSVALFPGRPSPPSQSNKREQLPASVTSTRLGTINPIPIDYGCRPRLRDRLTLRGLTLRRNPWTSGERVSHPLYRYSCQHSHFRCLQHTSRCTFTGLRNAPLPRQKTEHRNQKARTLSVPACITPVATQTLQHLRDFLILISPTLPRRCINVAEIMAIADPDANLVA